jgi:hypothetical protein
MDRISSPGTKILNQREIEDRILNKTLIKRSKTMKFYDSEDE